MCQSAAMKQGARSKTSAALLRLLELGIGSYAKSRTLMACHSKTFYAFFGLLFDVTDVVCRNCCGGRSWLRTKGGLKHGIVELNCAALPDKYRVVEQASGDDISPGKKLWDRRRRAQSWLESIFRCLLVGQRVTHWLTRDSELELRLNPSVTWYCTV
jgi:hypothetical protein